MKCLFLLGFLLLAAACNPAAPTTPDASSDANEVVIDWDVQQEEPGEFDQPNMSIALTLSGAVNDRIDLGTYAGSFADGRELSSLRASGSLLMGISWWAGGGDEIIVERTNDTTLTISHRTTDEQVEPGAFEPLETVTIPADAKVTLAPWREQ